MLVTGNRRINPQARILVVVAEILLNRLLQPEAFDFHRVSAVVMDEFHSFSDSERGIVWEFSLSLLPKHVRLLLLSATVGNAVAFTSWLNSCHHRNLRVVQSTERKVPISFQWVADKLLNEHLEEMAQGNDEARRTPALVFCFNREECWQVAEELKGRAMLAEGQQDRLVELLEAYDWSRGAGPKLKRILMRGVGVHHAGLLPRYRRIVEELFQFISEAIDPISIFIALTRRGLMGQPVRYLSFGEGETGLMVYTILLRYWDCTPEEDVRPLIFLMSD